MSLTALKKGTEEIVNSFNFENKPDGEFICKNCNTEMTWIKKSCLGRIQHFRHKIICPYETEPESKEHLEMKNFFFNEFSKIPNYKVVLEEKIQDRIADLFVKFDGFKIAIECQVSKISEQKFLERTKSYFDKGIFVIWVLNVKNFLKFHEACYEYNTQIVKVSKIEKILHKLHYGIVYYYNNKTVKPVHLSKRTVTYDGGKDWDERTITLKTIKYATFGKPIIEFELTPDCNDYNSQDYYIAHFNTKTFWKSDSSA